MFIYFSYNRQESESGSSFLLLKLRARAWCVCVQCWYFGALLSTVVCGDFVAAFGFATAVAGNRAASAMPSAYS